VIAAGSTLQQITRSWSPLMQPLAICRLRRLPPAIAAIILVTGTGRPVLAQEERKQEPPDTATSAPVPYRISPIVVTATRSETETFLVPKPVAVLGQSTILAQKPNTAADLFREMPGLDVTGVGTNQVRPSIRGQRGQRILLLADGLRINNSRRRQSFGEIPALIDVSSLERVEVVRGPASVLYGTDAIGGVVNLITRTPTYDGVHGRAGYRFSSHDGQQRVTGGLTARSGAWSLLAKGSFRTTDDYDAPAGSFGEISLNQDTRVRDTGTQDYSVDAYLGYELGSQQDLFFKYERYRADSAGFGYVAPEDYAPDEPFIQILYPFQNFDKYTVGFRGARLETFMTDKLDVVGYFQQNERRLSNNVIVEFFPGAGVDVATNNYTDLTTVGARLEAAKLVGSRVMVTYGLDLFRDDSENTDSSRTVMFGFGPPDTSISTTPLVPNATYLNTGAFLQGDIQITSRASLILSGRYQYLRSETEETAGATDPLQTRTYNTVVGAANAVYQLSDRISLVGTVGRGFRAPNLVEQFFDGITPEGAAYQVPNPDLEPETSLNFDLGARYRSRTVSLEAFVFNNEISDGIAIAPTGDSLNGLPTFWNVNVDKLRYRGVEVAGDVILPSGTYMGASYTHLDSKDVLNENNPIGDSYSNKFQVTVGYRHPSKRFFVEYALRHNGERKDSELSGPLGDSPIGTVLPSFTTHDVRGAVTVFRRGMHQHRLGFTVRNLTNALYAEFANAGFFRPEPQRSLIVSWDMTF
jgi:outer membrane receptor protein involved in Fe transport